MCSDVVLKKKGRIVPQSAFAQHTPAWVWPTCSTGASSEVELQPGMVVQADSPAIWEAESGGSLGLG